MACFLCIYYTLYSYNVSVTRGYDTSSGSMVAVKSRTTSISLLIVLFPPLTAAINSELSTVIVCYIIGVGKGQKSDYWPHAYALRRANLPHNVEIIDITRCHP